MKKLLIILAIVLSPMSVLASPFLGCNPYPPDALVIRYVGRIDGVAFETAYGSFYPDGSSIIYDMAGKDLHVVHTFTELRACNTFICSDPAVTFTWSAGPGAPTNLRRLN